MTEIKNKFNVLYGFNLMVSFMAMSTFVFSKHFAVDDYWAYVQQEESIHFNIESNLRPVSSLLLYVLNIIGINIVDRQEFFGFILLLVFAWAVTRITLEIVSLFDNANSISRLAFINSGSLVLLFNASISEYLCYTGTYPSWILSILGLTYAAIYIGKEERVTKNWILGTITLTVVAGSYQTFISQYAYIVMAILFIRNEGKITRKSILAVLRAAAAAFVAMGINWGIVKLLINIGIVGTNSRMDISISKLPELVMAILGAQKSIWIEGMGMYPNGSLGIILILMMVLLAVMVYRKNKLGGGIFAILVLISGQCVMYMAQIMQGYIRATNRGMMPIFGMYTVGIWILCYYAGEKEWKKIRKIGIPIMGIFLFFSIYKINEVAVDTIKTNTVSRCYIDEINRRICNYEQQKGIEVTKIGFCSDEYISYRYYDFIETSAYGDMCANPFLAEWSDINSIYYYTGRNFARVEVPEEVVEYYGSRNWDEADWDEQLVFDDDTVFVCVF